MKPHNNTSSQLIVFIDHTDSSVASGICTSTARADVLADQIKNCIVAIDKFDEPPATTEVAPKEKLQPKG